MQEKFEVMNTSFYRYKMQYLEEMLEMVCCQLTSGKGPHSLGPNSQETLLSVFWACDGLHEDDPHRLVC